MTNWLTVLLSFISIIFFLIALWKRPKITFRQSLVVLGIAIIVMLVGFVYQQWISPSEKFFKLDNSFYLVTASSDISDSTWDMYTFTYGTNQSIREVRDYVKSLATRKDSISFILSFIPGSEFIFLKTIEEYGDATNGVYLNIHFGQSNSVRIDIMPAFPRVKHAGFQTQVYMQYSLWKTTAGIKTYSRLLPLLLIGAVIQLVLWFGIVKSFKDGYLAFKKYK